MTFIPTPTNKQTIQALKYELSSNGRWVKYLAYLQKCDPTTPRVDILSAAYFGTCQVCLENSSCLNCPMKQRDYFCCKPYSQHNDLRIATIEAKILNAESMITYITEVLYAVTWVEQLRKIQAPVYEETAVIPIRVWNRIKLKFSAPPNNISIIENTLPPERNDTDG